MILGTPMEDILVGVAKTALRAEPIKATRDGVPLLRVRDGNGGWELLGDPVHTASAMVTADANGGRFVAGFIALLVPPPYGRILTEWVTSALAGYAKTLLARENAALETGASAGRYRVELVSLLPLMTVTVKLLDAEG